MIRLFAAHERESKRQQIGDRLALLSRHIDFAAIAQAVDAKLSLGTGTRGVPPGLADAGDDQAAAVEPPRDSRRLQLLRGWRHEQASEVFPRTCRSATAAAAVGGAGRDPCPGLRAVPQAAHLHAPPA
ncbi:hypothetical protein [Xanthomonas theicola]|uniref:hypothetical protein n=1 Tax=Xanthomonas theicola TaxID=56464 RepID=UPI000FF8951E|nr:hypothetical protein [Xanthomonas theicola]QNH26748.1 hypothetical protein G4Q83_21330 [Xanthomonas theicola]